MQKTNISWRRTAKTNLRMFRLMYKRYPQEIYSRTASVIWRHIMPYVGVYLSARLIDELTGARDPGKLKFLVLLILGVAALTSLGTALINRWRNVLNCNRWYKTEQIFTDKYLSMDFMDVEKPETAELRAKIRQNANGGGWGLNKFFQNYDSLWAAVLTIFGGVALTVSLFMSRVPESAGGYTVLNHPLFILLIVAAMLGLINAAPFFSNKAGSYRARYVNEHSNENQRMVFFGDLGTCTEFAADVRMYRQDRLCETFYANRTGLFGTKGLYARLGRGPVGLYKAASSAFSVVFMGVAYLFVCMKSWAGAFGLGSVTQYVTAITKVSSNMATFITTLGDMRNNTPYLEQVFAFLDIPNNMYQGSLTVEKRRDRQYDVEFRDVSFKYPGSDQYALRHVNVRFKIGKRLAVVGMNGSGKTTFIKLLCRLYDPTEGVILLNGIDIRKYNYLEYMGIFSVVFQDFKLLSLRLGENVASGTGYDPAVVTDCLEKAGFGDRLRELSDGLDTYLNKDYDKSGVTVSGGEAQKIAIARALYKNAPFIILDEPTASLDPIAEAEIYEKFNGIAGDKTAIYISHRLSSCKFCDEIMVFHEGAVIQHGTHATLLADESGKYHELWNAQAQYYVTKTEPNMESLSACIRGYVGQIY